MPLPFTQRTIDAISQVYSILGRPGDGVLPPSVICEEHWRSLDEVCVMIELSDRTYYMKPVPFTVAQNQIEYNIGEVENFGNELGLEIYDTSTGIEVTEPIPLLGDARYKNDINELAAYLYRDPDNPVMLTIRFNRPLTATHTFRLWTEPSEFARPKLGEPAAIPKQGWNFSIYNTAVGCLPHIAKVYDEHIYSKYEKRAETGKSEWLALWTKWLLNDPTVGIDHRIAWNERRRGLGYYGGLPSFRRNRGLVIGDA